MLRIAKKDYIMSLDNPESYNPNVFVNLEIRKDTPKTPEDEVFEETIQCLDLIISSRTNVFKKFELKLNEIYKTKDINQLVQFINDFPSILKRPIILEEETEKIQIGFNEEDIRDFLPQNINDAVYKHFMGMEWKSNLTKEELDVVDKLIKSTFKTKNRKQAKRKKSYDNFDVETVDDDYEEDDDSDEE
jgi:arsenate reductase-like glutaredoxin family protein